MKNFLSSLPEKGANSLSEKGCLFTFIKKKIRYDRYEKDIV